MKAYYFFVVMVGALGANNDLIDRIKHQNILYTSPDYSVGLYKQDLVNAGFFANYIMADSLLYKKLMAGTVDKTMRAIIKDLDGLIAVLERTKNSEDRFEERMAFTAYQGDTSLSKGRRRYALFNPLRRYLNRVHNVDSVMNSRVLYALALRWGWDRVSGWLEKELVVPPLSVAEQFIGLSNDVALREAHVNAYVYEGDDLVRTHYAPYSATTLVKGVAFVASPFMALRASLRSGRTSYRVGRLAFVSRMLGAGLPEKLFSQGVKTLLELVELGGSVSFFNEANRYHWIRFVVQRRYELLRLLYAYRYVLEDPTGEEAHVTLIKQEIYDFVKRGYTRTSWLPGVTLRQWWSSQGRSSRTVGSWLRYATLAIMGIKSAHWIYDMNDQP